MIHLLSEDWFVAPYYRFYNDYWRVKSAAARNSGWQTISEHMIQLKTKFKQPKPNKTGWNELDHAAKLLHDLTTAVAWARTLSVNVAARMRRAPMMA